MDTYIVTKYLVRDCASHDLRRQFFKEYLKQVVTLSVFLKLFFVLFD